MTNKEQQLADGKDQNFETQSLALLQQLVHNQAALSQQLTDLETHNISLRQQVVQFGASTSAQCSALEQSEIALRNELGKFQTGKAQRAMASVFYKLFRDLLNHMNQLDDLAPNKDQARDEAERAWIASIEALRGHFESILIDWGCQPIVIEENVDVFDPEFHEAVGVGDGDIPSSIPENIIVRVKRRGWKLQDYIVQYPQVVVS